MADSTDCEQFTDAIDDLVDETIGSSSRLELDAHLAGCPACRALVADFRRIRTTAGALERRTPPPHAWTAISARFRSETMQSRRQRLTRWGQLAAAAVLLLTLGAATVYWLQTAGPVPPAGSASTSPDAGASSPPPGEEAAPGDTASQTANPAAAGSVESIATELKLAEDHYTRAISGLEQVARSQEEALDPEIAETLRRYLQIIDQAIEESRAALNATPGSMPAQESLFEALRRKVGLLQDTIALINEMRKGNQAGAARIVEGLNKS
jgi:hypothetical protein